MADPVSCPDAATYQTSTGLKIVLFYQVSICFLAIVTTYLCMKKHVSGFYHSNYTVLLRLYLLTFIFHGAALGAIQGYHLISYLFLDPCEIYVNLHTCFVFRHISNTMTTTMSYVELALTFERAIALIYRKKYDLCGSKLGISLALLSIIFGEGSNIYLMSFSFPLQGKTKLCTASMFYKALPGINLGNVFIYLTISIDTFSAFLLIVIHYISKRMRRIKTYNLAVRFEEKRNKDVLAGLLPTMLFHSIFSVGLWTFQWILINYFSWLSEIQYKIIGAASNAVPLYTLLAPLLMLWMQRKTRNRTVRLDDAKGDEYHKTYTTMWN